jgi:hypothetical protein
MRNRGSVRSFIESHRAKATRPDRRNFYPKPASFRPHCGFPGGFPNYEAASSKRHCPSPMGLRLSLCSWRRSPVNAPVPTGGKAVPNGPADAPNFSAVFPIAPRVFPNEPATFPNFPPAALIYNILFPSYLGSIAAKERKKRKEKPSPVLSDTLSHRMGEGWGEGPLTLNHQLTTKN